MCEKSTVEKCTALVVLGTIHSTKYKWRDALKKLSAAKYGRPRAEVEREIFARLGAGDAARKAKADALKQAQADRLAALRGSASNPNAPQPAGSAMVPPRPPASSSSSFLDDWLAKRQQLQATQPSSQAKPAPAPNPAFGPTIPSSAPVSQPAPQPVSPVQEIKAKIPREKPPEAPQSPAQPPAEPDRFHVRESDKNGSDDGMHIQLR